MCADFILPSLAALSTQLTFILEKLIKHPEILKKCQDEIDKNVGRGRLPSLDDRNK